ncbi:MAG: SDR family oxidoreductase [Phycisphaerales bacterium]|nr:SDR family oxidoreductase [Phycisphaerales bacterium]
MSDSRVALITGANKGIGLETARQLGRLGTIVLLGSRDQARGQHAAETLRGERVDARFVPLDVTNSDSIAAAARSIERDFGVLDILVNNAAVMFHGEDGLASTTSMRIFRETFDVNFFGMIETTQAMLPLIRKSPSGRIVNLTSNLGSIAEHSDPHSSIYHVKISAYDFSKVAVNMFTQHLAHELRDTSIKVNAAHPGWVKTDMGGPHAQLELADGARTGVQLATLPADGPTGGYFHMGVHMRW